MEIRVTIWTWWSKWTFHLCFFKHYLKCHSGVDLTLVGRLGISIFSSNSTHQYATIGVVQLREFPKRCVHWWHSLHLENHVYRSKNYESGLTTEWCVTNCTNTQYEDGRGVHIRGFPAISETLNFLCDIAPHRAYAVMQIWYRYIHI